MHPVRNRKETLMNTGLRSSLSGNLFQAALVCGLLLMPLVSHESTFFGSGGLTNTATGEPNLAFGYGALFSNTTGTRNTAIGVTALNANTTGSDNIALGYGALIHNTTGSENTANGVEALA